VKGRNPSLATKAGLGAGATLLGLGWRLGRRSVTDNEQLVRAVWAAAGISLTDSAAAAMDSGQSADHK
jgi:hypothetical protein